jgi:hypothetical protein
MRRLPANLASARWISAVSPAPHHVNIRPLMGPDYFSVLAEVSSRGVRFPPATHLKAHLASSLSSNGGPSGSHPLRVFR